MKQMDYDVIQQRYDIKEQRLKNQISFLENTIADRDIEIADLKIKLSKLHNDNKRMLQQIDRLTKYSNISKYETNLDSKVIKLENKHKFWKHLFGK